MTCPENTLNPETKSPPNFKVPHTYVIIFSLIILASIATWLIPGGAFDREKVQTIRGEREVVKSDSFHYVDSVPQNPWMMIQSIMKGLTHHSAADIIFFILIIGGAFGIITKTRAVDAALSRLIQKIGHREKLLIPVIMVSFSIGGATFGMCEETIPFIVMVVPLALELGYDSITGVAMVYIGATIGFATAFLNPFTVGIAQGIAGIPIFSGFSYRIFLWLFFTSFTIWWIMRYAAKIKKNPELSLMYDLDTKKREVMAQTEEIPLFDIPRKTVMLGIVVTFVLIIYGAIQLDWYINEMVALFLTLGILSGIICRLPLNDMADSFSKGVSDIANAAILVGFARAVLVLLEDGKVMDTILHGVSQIVGNLPPVISVQFMYAFQTITNIFVPSGSGQAALTMPIMAPLADMVGITRQTAVLAYQFGDGFTNMIIPTSAVTIAVLGMAGVPWSRWAKWITPLMFFYFLLGALFLIPPVIFGWNG